MRQAHADILADYRAESMDTPENVSFSTNYRGSRMDCNLQFQEQLTPELLRVLTASRSARTRSGVQENVPPTEVVEEEVNN